MFSAHSSFHPHSPFCHTIRVWWYVCVFVQKALFDQQQTSKCIFHGNVCSAIPRLSLRHSVRIRFHLQPLLLSFHGKFSSLTNSLFGPPVRGSCSVFNLELITSIVTLNGSQSSVRFTWIIAVMHVKSTFSIADVMRMSTMLPVLP